MQMIRFDSAGWSEWDVARRPAIPEGMPVLVDDDLLFEDGGVPRPACAVNEWLRSLPASGVPAKDSWIAYARAVKVWAEHLSEHGFALFDVRQNLKDGLSAYAVRHEAGALEERWEVSTWNQQVGILSGFYQWASAEGYAAAVPFTYKQAAGLYSANRRGTATVNAATRRAPKPHVTLNYLEREFADNFVNALRGLKPDGSEETGFKGRQFARNGAIGAMVISTGLRRSEFTNLLVYEVPALPLRPLSVPIPFEVPGRVAKGRKFRRTWIDYEVLSDLHGYFAFEREATATGSRWLPPAKWGEPLHVTDPDARGGRVNGARVSWASLRPAERRRLVAPDGGSCLLALKPGGGPFTAWASVFARTATRIRDTYDPRFPHVWPHRLRHTFAMLTYERLIGDHYKTAAKLVADTDADAALMHALLKAEPLVVLRDLLGHSTALTTEMYIKRLDVTRIYADAYTEHGRRAGLLPADQSEAEREAEEEFADDLGDD